MASLAHDDTMLDVGLIRQRFPALQQTVKGITPVYFDNPGGTQVPESVLDAMRRYLVEANSNTHGGFHTSKLTDQTIAAAREAMADLLNANSNEIIFGPNMTTPTFSMSRAIGRTLMAGDEVVVTKMDHDANIAPWLLLARDHDLVVRWAEFDTQSGRLDLEQMGSLLNDRTKVVACVYASNALGTINDMAAVTEMAHMVGALVYVDAVQYTPHGLVDVKALDCDFLACSSYKFFGPHMGTLYGKTKHLESLPAYKVRPASDEAPDRWETGTGNHEGMAGVTAAVEHLAWVGETFGEADAATDRRSKLVKSMQVIKAYEMNLSRALIEGLGAIKGVTIKGITDLDALDQRVPTVIFRVEGIAPADMARKLGDRGVYVWDGNYYALSIMETLDYEDKGGMVRVGAAHYNTLDEVQRFLNGVEDIASRT